jgi:hypothetical protein
VLDGLRAGVARRTGKGLKTCRKSR